MKNNILRSLLLVGMLMITACNPFKITDPNDPKFDPYKFSFGDFNAQNEKYYLQALFPIGTDKVFIDKILIGAGKAKKFQSSGDKNIWHYAIPEIITGFGRGSYIVIYDKNDRLLNIQSPLTAKYIYPDQIKYTKGIRYK